MRGRCRREGPCAIPVRAFLGLADAPPEAKWFANIDNRQTVPGFWVHTLRATAATHGAQRTTTFHNQALRLTKNGLKAIPPCFILISSANKLWLKQMS